VALFAMLCIERLGNLIELVGPVTYLDLSIGDRSLRASVSGSSRISAGQEFAISFEPNSVHFFDRATGNRIAGGYSGC